MNLGDRVRDVYTGFEGIFVARTEWLYGCARITIEPTELREGKPIDMQTFDEQRVELVEELKPIKQKTAKAKTGGPYPSPTRH